MCKEDVNLQPKKRAKRYTEHSLKEHMKRHKQTAARITPPSDPPLSREKDTPFCDHYCGQRKDHTEFCTARAAYCRSYFTEYAALINLIMEMIMMM